MKWTVRHGDYKKPKTYSAPAGPVSGFFLVLLGLAFLGGGAWTGKSTYTLVTTGIHAEGTVSNVDKSTRVRSRDRNGYHETSVETTYKYTVDFTDEKGTAYSFTDGMSDSSGNYGKGDKVGVIYLGTNPKGSAIIDRGFMNWLLPGALGMFGLIAALAGASAMMKPRKTPDAGSGPDQYKAG